ncbi:MAG: chondroitinase-B domain-containing protein [Verrucomicrobiota bacterium]
MSGALLLEAAARSTVGNTLIETPKELSKLDDAQPGDVFVLKDGTWKDVVIYVKRGGDAKNAVVLRAQTPGKVRFTGECGVHLTAPYVTLDGFVFSGPHEKNSVVTLRSHNGVLQNCAFVGLKPGKPTTESRWLWFQGPENLVTNCYFTGKNNAGTVVHNDGYRGRSNTVCACLFKDIDFSPVLRQLNPIFNIFGPDETDEDGSFFTIEGNLFDHANGEDQLLVIKSSRNRIVRNTILESRGVINLRDPPRGGRSRHPPQRRRRLRRGPHGRLRGVHGTRPHREARTLRVTDRPGQTGHDEWPDPVLCAGQTGHH